MQKNSVGWLSASLFPPFASCMLVRPTCLGGGGARTAISTMGQTDIDKPEIGVNVEI